MLNKVTAIWEHVDIPATMWQSKKHKLSDNLTVRKQFILIIWFTLFGGDTESRGAPEMSLMISLCKGKWCEHVDSLQTVMGVYTWHCV